MGKNNTGQAYVATNLTVNDGLVVNETLAVDTITKRSADEATVESDLAIGGTLLVDTSHVSLATEISIKDYVVAGSTTANTNLTVTGNLSVFGNVNFSKPYWVAVVMNFFGWQSLFRKSKRRAKRSDSPCRSSGTNYWFTPTSLHAHRGPTTL